MVNDVWLEVDDGWFKVDNGCLMVKFWAGGHDLSRLIMCFVRVDNAEQWLMIINHNYEPWLLTTTNHL